MLNDTKVGSLIDRIRQDQLQRWERGERRLIEAYLDEHPQIRSQREAMLDLIYGEFCLRKSYGEEPLKEDYYRRFDDLSCDLSRLFQIDAAIADIPSAVVNGTHETLGPDGNNSTNQGEQGNHRALKIRCPHCASRITAPTDDAIESIVCISCGSSFNLVDTVNETRLARAQRTIGHFDLIEQVGSGAFGTVWKARDNELDRTVAIKLPRKGQLTASEAEQFYREARMAAQLRHPNIVSVHEVGRIEDSIYIVSDFVHGVTLADWLTGQRLSAREAAELCAKIASALHHAHEAGVVHRDLKPGNIMLDANGEPHLMDFGLAKREVGEITVTAEGGILGTPAYMSPEQARGEGHHADRRSDIYSLGVLMYQLLTGELPFRGNVRMLLHQVLNDEPRSPRKLNDRIPRDLETICLKAMMKEPSHRYHTAENVAADLHRFLSGEPVLAQPITRTRKLWRWCKRHRGLVVASALLMTAVGVGTPIIVGLISQAAFERGRADREMGRADIERERAVTERERAVTEGNRADLLLSLIEPFVAQSVNTTPNSVLRKRRVELIELLERIVVLAKKDELRARALDQAMKISAFCAQDNPNPDEKKAQLHDAVQFAKRTVEYSKADLKAWENYAFIIFSCMREDHTVRASPTWWADLNSAFDRTSELAGNSKKKAAIALQRQKYEKQLRELKD